MTLLDVINRLEGVAKTQPQVSEVVGRDVYLLNEKASVTYGVFAWTQSQHSFDLMGDSTTYGFTLFYVDRLKADKSNTEEVQSVGVQVIKNILRTLAGEMGVSNGNITPFMQRFTDECAGVFCNVSLTAPDDTICEQSFA